MTARLKETNDIIYQVNECTLAENGRHRLQFYHRALHLTCRSYGGEVLPETMHVI